MFDTFLYAFNAVTPMLLLMLLGWGLKAAHFFDDELLRKMVAAGYLGRKSGAGFYVYEKGKKVGVNPVLVK